jgi:hypothetical protein
MSESTLTTSEGPPLSRQALAARDRSLPGRVTGRLRVALDAMVWEAASRKEAAEKAGMTDHSLHQALRRPHVMAYYRSECEVLRLSGRAKRLHRLEALGGQDGNAAVAAIKAAEQIGDEQATSPNGIIQRPGLVIVIQERETRPVTAELAVIEHDLGEGFLPPALPDGGEGR